jgi:hypothetical protein
MKREIENTLQKVRCYISNPLLQKEEKQCQKDKDYRKFKRTLFATVNIPKVVPITIKIPKRKKKTPKKKKTSFFLSF